MQRVARRNCWRGLGLTMAAAAPLAVFSPTLADVEWEERNSYYEDDAWYDITEWFDANDYNPTDEDPWEWDDETYQSWDDPGYDWDNDYVYDYDYDYDYDYEPAGVTPSPPHPLHRTMVPRSTAWWIPHSASGWIAAFRAKR